MNKHAHTPTHTHTHTHAHTNALRQTHTNKRIHTYTERKTDRQRYNNSKSASNRKLPEQTQKDRQRYRRWKRRKGQGLFGAKVRPVIWLMESHTMFVCNLGGRTFFAFFS